MGLLVGVESGGDGLVGGGAALLEGVELVVVVDGPPVGAGCGVGGRGGGPVAVVAVVGEGGWRGDGGGVVVGAYGLAAGECQRGCKAAAIVQIWIGLT